MQLIGAATPKVPNQATMPQASKQLPNTKNWRIGYLTPAFSGDPQKKGTKSEAATSPLPSRGPIGGRFGYATPAFSGISNRRGPNQKWLHHPAFLGAYCLVRGGKNRQGCPPKGGRGGASLGNRSPWGLGGLSRVSEGTVHGVAGGGGGWLLARPEPLPFWPQQEQEGL